MNTLVAVLRIERSYKERNTWSYRVVIADYIIKDIFYRSDDSVITTIKKLCYRLDITRPEFFTSPFSVILKRGEAR